MLRGRREGGKKGGGREARREEGGRQEGRREGGKKGGGRERGQHVSNVCHDHCVLFTCRFQQFLKNCCHYYITITSLLHHKYIVSFFLFSPLLYVNSSNMSF